MILVAFEKFFFVKILFFCESCGSCYTFKNLIFLLFLNSALRSPGILVLFQPAVVIFQPEALHVGRHLRSRPGRTLLRIHRLSHHRVHRQTQVC
jgi:hypothetical protein